MIFAVIVASVTVSGEVINDDNEVVSLYARGKRMLRQGDFYEAKSVFEELTGRFSESKNIDLFIFNRAKAELYLDEYSKTIASFSYFIKRFRNSTELPYAYFFRGNGYYLNGDVNRSIKDYLEALALSKSDKLDQILIASINGAFKNAGSIGLMKKDFKDLPENKRCKIVKALAEIQILRGEFSKAEELLASCGESVDYSSLGNRTEKLKDNYEIAFVLPFSGELNSFAQDIFNGGVIAAQMFRAETGKSLKLTPYDTKGDPIDAARIISEISRSFSTDAAVGPLTSEEAAVSSAVLNCGSLPLVIPAATQAGLTRLSETTFQLSPNIELEGIRMAEYAIRNVLADSAVIITSTNSDHLRMARAFSDRFEQLGGTILAIEYYRPRDNDFGKIIRDIKGMLIGYHPDSTYFITPDGDTLSTEEIIANVDCLFMPGSPSQLRQLAQQLHFYSLNGFYLGSDGWSDQSVLKLGERVTKGVVFPSPFLSSGSSEEYFTYAAMYDSRFKGQPTRLANLGFDAVRLISLAIKNGNHSKELISDYLKSIDNYDGSSGKISFGKNRENLEMPLFHIKLKQAIPLESPVSQPEETELN